ncbi:hypothetical protein [Chitinophaga varians]|uniref:hypothetical protein n=1 Tax=Chitinophaga varians TaxID=2202339 RepID=UPI00165F479E|nr:hypothetical protein [Chitinophaga varians]MBC9914323.1 hypothetical protein [Chitinophaga varians]
MIKYLFSFALLILSVTTFAQKTDTLKNKEFQKLLKFFANERLLLRKEACPECTYLINIKLFFDKNRKVKKIILSKSTPESLQGMSGRLEKLDINWGLFVAKAAGNDSFIGILPVVFACEGPKDRLTLSSKGSIFDLYQFEDGSLSDKWEMNKYQFLNGVVITTTSVEVDTGDYFIKKKQ